MNNHPNEQFALKAIQALVGALSHKLRTPLSVVQNDLSYLATVFQPEEFVRPIERCKQISQVLSASRVPKIDSTQVEELNLSDLVEREGWIPEGESAGEHKIPANRAALTFVAKQWLTLFQSVDVQGGSYRGPIAISKSEAVLSLAATCTLSRNPPSTGQQYNYFIDPFYNVMNLDSLEAPLIDAVVVACGWKAELSLNQSNLTATLRL